MTSKAQSLDYSHYWTSVSMLTIMATVALFFNIAIVIWKLRKASRRVDGVVDLAILIGVFVVFSGSTSLLIIGTIGSMLVSIYLLISPIRLPNADT